MVILPILSAIDDNYSQRSPDFTPDLSVHLLQSPD